MALTWYDFTVTSAGVRQAGLTPVFASFVSSLTGAAISPQPAIVEIGDGDYAFQYDPASLSGEFAGVIDAGSAIPDATDRFVRLGSNGGALPPNPAMTLRPLVPGYAGRDFLRVTPDAATAYTFNLAPLLNGGVIAAVNAVTIEAADATTAQADGSPASRLVAGPAVDESGTQVTVRLGAWLAGMVPLCYRVSVLATDLAGNEIAVFANAAVAQRSDQVWQS
jgi:hypothetical protein